MMRRYIFCFILLGMVASAKAQVGSYRNDLAIGFNGGYQISHIGFVPKVSQGMGIGGITAGAVLRYTCEKYFSTVCAVQLEVNYAQMGWKEKILSVQDQPCINNLTGVAEEYSRKLTYIQVPLLAHLSWGREVRGANFFFNLGPQLGYLIGEKTVSNFDYSNQEAALNTTPSRVSSVIAQDTMAVKNKVDYGIAAGLGVEYSIPGAGHIQLEARYYYGLGNIFGSSKKDTFARSNQGSIIVKAAYLFDLFTTKNCERK